MTEGKSIFVQYLKRSEIMDKWFLSQSIVGNYMYWMTNNDSLLMRMDLTDHKVKYITPLLDESLNEMIRSSMLGIFDDNIVCVLNKGKHIMMTDINDGHSEIIPINCEALNLDMFSASFISDNFLYILPMYSPYMININLKTRKVNKNNILNISESRELIQFFSLNSQKDKEYLFFISCITNEFIKYDWKNNIVLEEIPISIHDDTVVNFTNYCNDIYFLTSKGQILKMNKNTKSIDTVFCISPSSEHQYLQFFVDDKIAFLFPSYADNIVKVDLSSRTSEILVDLPLDYGYYAPKSMAKFWKSTETERYVVFSMHSGNYILQYDKEKKKMNFIAPIWLSENDYLCELSKINRIVYYEAGTTLQEFMELLSMKGDNYYEKSM